MSLMNTFQSRSGPTHHQVFEYLVAYSRIVFHCGNILECPLSGPRFFSLFSSENVQARQLDGAFGFLKQFEQAQNILRRIVIGVAVTRITRLPRARQFFIGDGCFRGNGGFVNDYIGILIRASSNR